MKRLGLFVCLLAASAVALDPQAEAQPASAIGKPLAAPNLAPGTVSVRAIAGTTSSPVTGADVTLLVDNVPRVMRTDGGGRAIFTGVPINAKVQAKIQDSEKKDIMSESFSVPEQGGIQLMLSTKPFAGGAAMQAMGMPTGRKASGQPQFDDTLPGGTYQVRLTHDNLTMKDGFPTDLAPPVGSMVTLVGYTHDNTVTVKQQPIDPTGVTRFEGLDVSGGTVYYALATLPRNGAFDRMMAMPVAPTSGGGSKVILSGDKRDATSKPVDDLAVPAAIATPAGKVRITLDGIVQEASPIRLVDAATKLEIGRMVPSRPPPDTSKVESAAQFTKGSSPAGTIAINIHGGPGSQDKPLPEVAIRIVKVTMPPEHAPGATGTDAPEPGSVVDTAGRAVDTAGTPIAPAPEATGSGAGSAAGSAASTAPSATGSAAPAAGSKPAAGSAAAGSVAGSATSNAGSNAAPPTGASNPTTRPAAGSAAGSAAVPAPTSPVPAAAGSGAPTSATPTVPANSGSAAATPAAQTNQQHASSNNASPTTPAPAAPAPIEGEATPAKTDANGMVTLTLTPGTYKAYYIINGKQFETTPFDVSQQGGTLEAVARWEGEGRMQALFDLVPRANQVVYAESVSKGMLYRSLPFLPVASGGTHVSIVIYPPALFNFSLRALIDDEQLAVRGTFTIEHRSWIPYRDDPDGMIIPLPRGFKGAVIAPESQNDVTVAPGEGFRILRPIPPGGMKFIGGFSLDAEDGNVHWALDLPNGTFNSGIEIRKSEGMSVKGLPPGTNSRIAEAENGSQWIVVFPISIHRGKSMQMTIAGVPSHPAWKTWVPRFVGVIALALILGGIAFAVISRKRAPVVDVDARKQKLLDELVELERSGADPARKEALVAELERLWK